MHRRQDHSEPLEQEQAQALEYVAGTLRGEERSEFEQRLKNTEKLQDLVNFWEEQLFYLHETKDVLEPAPESWQKIADAINPSSPSTPVYAKSTLRGWLPWGFSLAFSALLVFAVSLYNFKGSSIAQPPADYVAVLTDNKGGARLTALSSGSSKTMWLQWGDVVVKKGQSIQLWAISRTDGQTRSIVVLDEVGGKQLPLSEVNWRLITDSESLILTEEEKGGSPLDEPSDTILAKGVCVRFRGDEKQS